MNAAEIEEMWQILRETEKIVKENALGMAELRAAQQETDRQLKDLKEQVSGVSKNVGYSAEEYFQTALAKDLKFGGIQFDDMIPNLSKNRRGKSCEFDIVLVNHSAVGIIDAKHRVHNTLPEVMATRKAAEFRSFFPEYNNHKLYLGVAGFSIDKAAIPQAEKYGVGILKQDGDAVKAVNIKLKEY